MAILGVLMKYKQSQTIASRLLTDNRTDGQIISKGCKQAFYGAIDTERAKL